MDRELRFCWFSARGKALPVNTTIIRMLLGLFLLYLVVCVYAVFFSESVIFQPHRSSYHDTPEIVKIASSGGKKISGIYLPNPSARFTLLVSHGNGEDLGDIRDWLEDLRRAGFSVFAYDYQGYGTSEGRPGENAAYADESAAYDFLAIVLGTPPDRIIIFGRSVGTGPAVQLAARRPAAALVLQSPFLSAFRVLTRVSLLPFDRFPNYKRIGHVHCPVLIMHGTADSVIPLWQGKKLFQLANEPKQFVAVEGADHNDVSPVITEIYNRALVSFAVNLYNHAPGEANE
jgi:abhydrolase domain-containing protein 17